MKGNRTEKRLFLPRYALILYGIAVFSLAVYLVAVLSPSFAGWFQGTVAVAVRFCLGHLTGVLPFSLAEILIFTLPLLIALLGFLAWQRCTTWRNMGVFLASVLSVVSLLFTLFVFSFGAGYHTAPLDERLSLPTNDVSAEELRATAVLLAERVNQAAQGVEFGEDGFSKMPYDLQGMNERLLEAYGGISQKYSFIPRLGVGVKPVLASKAMSYTHITGVYTYFTGEANVNVYFPDYTLPYTAAHEMAHQRGIARENEANFVAFLVCAESGDAYLQYTAYLNLFEYVANALWQADREAYREVLSQLAPEVFSELRAYDAFFEQFRDSALADVSNAVNDTYLKVHGNKEGTASYGLVVDLAVAYFKE